MFVRVKKIEIYAINISMKFKYPLLENALTKKRHGI